MIIAYAYEHPFYDKEIRVENSSGAKPNTIPTKPNSFFEFKPRGEGPWSMFIGTSTVLTDIQEADSLVVYAGQHSTVTTNGL
jgi:hypothetical protein